ncbi:MAG: hypothetical protein H7070_11240 [Saprospiraceae bacterium]|nr:hypothetical protein [Pyrinomonadaceae bacterium]
MDEAKRTFLKIIEAIEEHESEKVLIDGREVVGNPSIVERFYYGEFAADTVTRSTQRVGYGAGPQFAYALHEPVLDPLRLGETVAVNRGMNIKVFDNLDEAANWLKLTPEEIRYVQSLASRTH